MGAGHAHGPSPASATPANQRRLAAALALALVYMVAEVAGGLLTNSLALLADAGHMLADAGALALSLFALRMARRPATARRTYGFHRTEILAALANGATLVAIAAFLLLEAWQRFQAPPEVRGGPMTVVAAGGLLVNLAALWILRGGRGESLNVRGAWLHVATDALGSLQAIVAGALIWAFGWRLADPIATAAIALLVVWSSWSLLKETVAVLMEAAPGHIDVAEVREAMLGIPNVAAVHDLHVWTITSGMESLSAHVVAAGEAAPCLREIRETLHHRFGIHHITIQVEPEGFDETGACC